MGYYDKLNEGCKSVRIRTAIKKLKEGKTIRIADYGRTLFKARNKNTEIWMLYPDCNWQKYGSLKSFCTDEHDRRFIEA